uniref:Uncharacterized protein n=1 Tax=Macrostomum lignano TaxID=282301 RepID=A0A1I8GIE9_9PLAT
MPVEDFRPELKHVEPEASNFKRLLELRKVERSEELESKINRPKPSVTDILRVERESDLKARLFRDPEVEQAELMYTNVQANLRGGHYAGMLESQQHGRPQQNQVPQPQQQLQQQPQQQLQQQPMSPQQQIWPQQQQMQQKQIYPQQPPVPAQQL